MSANQNVAPSPRPRRRLSDLSDKMAKILSERYYAVKMSPSNAMRYIALSLIMLCILTSIASIIGICVLSEKQREHDRNLMKENIAAIVAASNNSLNETPIIQLPEYAIPLRLRIGTFIEKRQPDDTFPTDITTNFGTRATEVPTTVKAFNLNGFDVKSSQNMQANTFIGMYEDENRVSHLIDCCARAQFVIDLIETGDTDLCTCIVDRGVCAQALMEGAELLYDYQGLALTEAQALRINAIVPGCDNITEEVGTFPLNITHAYGNMKNIEWGPTSRLLWNQASDVLVAHQTSTRLSLSDVTGGKFTSPVDILMFVQPVNNWVESALYKTLFTETSGKFFPNNQNPGQPLDLSEILQCGSKYIDPNPYSKPDTEFLSARGSLMLQCGVPDGFLPMDSALTYNQIMDPKRAFVVSPKFPVRRGMVYEITYGCTMINGLMDRWSYTREGHQLNSQYLVPFGEVPVHAADAEDDDFNDDDDKNPDNGLINFFQGLNKPDDPIKNDDALNLPGDIFFFNATQTRVVTNLNFQSNYYVFKGSVGDPGGSLTTTLELTDANLVTQAVVYQIPNFDTPVTKYHNSDSGDAAYWDLDTYNPGIGYMMIDTTYYTDLLCISEDIHNFDCGHVISENWSDRLCTQITHLNGDKITIKADCPLFYQSKCYPMVETTVRYQGDKYKMACFRYQIDDAADPVPVGYSYVNSIVYDAIGYSTNLNSTATSSDVLPQSTLDTNNCARFNTPTLRKDYLTHTGTYCWNVNEFVANRDSSTLCGSMGGLAMQLYLYCMGEYKGTPPAGLTEEQLANTTFSRQDDLFITIHRLNPIVMNPITAGIRQRVTNRHRTHRADGSMYMTIPDELFDKYGDDIQFGQCAVYPASSPHLINSFNELNSNTFQIKVAELLNGAPPILGTPADPKANGTYSSHNWQFNIKPMCAINGIPPVNCHIEIEAVLPGTGTAEDLAFVATSSGSSDMSSLFEKRSGTTWTGKHSTTTQSSEDFWKTVLPQHRTKPTQKEFEEALQLFNDILKNPSENSKRFTMASARTQQFILRLLHENLEIYKVEEQRDMEREALAKKMQDIYLQL